MLPSNHSLSGALQQKGINRRRFLKFCSLMTATLALPPRYVAPVAAALEERKPVLVWLQFTELRWELRVHPPFPPHRAGSGIRSVFLGIPRVGDGRCRAAGGGHA